MWEKQSGEGRWQDYVNTETGEHSIKEHKLKLVKQWCPKQGHDYVITDLANRQLECLKCGHESHFVLGKYRVEGNRVVPNIDNH